MSDGRRQTADRSTMNSSEVQRSTVGRLPPAICGPSSALVIGYGNTLRGDDAIGPLVAEAVMEWALLGVAARAVHQLTPELAPELAEAGVAVFVDAREALRDDEAVEIQQIEPARTPTAIGHVGDPRDLLALANVLYGACPRAWLVTVPARHFATGTELSVEARAGMERALEHVWKLVKGG
jgi:hydrogenase maturation protease